MADEAATTNTESLPSTGIANPTATTETVAQTDDAAAGSALGDAGEGDAVEGDKLEASAEGDKGQEAEKAEVPEAYELTAPEGFTLDAKHVDAATPVFKELGLSNDQANKLIPVAADFAKDIADGIAAQQLQEVTKWRNERLTEAKADPDVGGAKWDESLALSAKALDQFGAPKGSEFRNWLSETGLGNHVEFVRMFSKIGRAVGEDGFERADGNPNSKQPREAVLYPNDVRSEGAK